MYLQYLDLSLYFMKLYDDSLIFSKSSNLRLLLALALSVVKNLIFKPYRFKSPTKEPLLVSFAFLNCLKMNLAFLLLIFADPYLFSRVTISSLISC